MTTSCISYFYCTKRTFSAPHKIRTCHLESWIKCNTSTSQCLLFQALSGSPDLHVPYHSPSLYWFSTFRLTHELPLCYYFSSEWKKKSWTYDEFSPYSNSHLKGGNKLNKVENDDITTKHVPNQTRFLIQRPG